MTFLTKVVAARDEWKKHGYIFKHRKIPSRDLAFGEELWLVTVYEPDKTELGGHIASGEFVVNKHEKSITPTTVGTNMTHQRQGIMNEIYKLMERETGFKIVPSTDIKPDGRKFWNQKNRPFG